MSSWHLLLLLFCCWLFKYKCNCCCCCCCCHLGSLEVTGAPMEAAHPCPHSPCWMGLQPYTSLHIASTLQKKIPELNLKRNTTSGRSFEIFEILSSSAGRNLWREILWTNLTKFGNLCQTNNIFRYLSTFSNIIFRFILCFTNQISWFILHFVGKPIPNLTKHSKRHRNTFQLKHKYISQELNHIHHHHHHHHHHHSNIHRDLFSLPNHHSS